MCSRPPSLTVESVDLYPFMGGRKNATFFGLGSLRRHGTRERFRRNFLDKKLTAEVLVAYGPSDDCTAEVLMAYGPSDDCSVSWKLGIGLCFGGRCIMWARYRGEVYSDKFCALGARMCRF